jgi:predicted MFS family arabinose efflux permease
VRRVLGLSAYRRLVGAYALNELTWAIGSLTLAVFVYRRTGSALGAAAFFLCSQFVPALLSPLLVGRLDLRARREVLALLYALEGIAYLALAWMVRSAALPLLLVVITADGTLALSARSLARASTVAVTSPAGLLREGNALINIVFSVCYTVGPVVGAAIVGVGGTRTALLCNSGLFGLTVLLLLTSGALPAPPTERSPIRGRVRAALAYARKRRPIRALLTLRIVGLLFFTMSIPVELVFSQRTLHAGAGGYGALLASWGAGAVAGSALYARKRAAAARTMIALGACLMGVGFVAMALAPSITLAAAGSAIAGAGNGVEGVAATTALQEQVNERWMALMMSLNESILQGAPGAGILLGATLADLAGPRIALAVAGAGALAVTAAVIGGLGSLGDSDRCVGEFDDRAADGLIVSSLPAGVQAPSMGQAPGLDP